MNLRTKLCTRLATLSLMLTCSWGAAAATTYTVTKLHDVAGKQGSSGVFAMSASGVCVGWSWPLRGARQAAAKWIDVKPVKLRTGGSLREWVYAVDSMGLRQAGMVNNIDGSQFQAIVWNWDGDGSPLRLEPSGVTAYSAAEGINASGLVVGRSSTTYESPSLPVTWRLPSTKPKALSLLPGATGGSAWAVNDHDTIVGLTTLPTGDRATRWQKRDGVAEDLGSLGGSSYAWAVNRSGVIVGSSSTSDDAFSKSKPVKWVNGVITELGAFGDSASAEAINDSGTVVGSAKLGGVWRAVVWEGLEAVDLNTRVVDAGWQLYFARGIDNAGRIVVTAIKTNTGAYHPVVLTPVKD